MTVLGALGIWLTDIRGTLPRKPYSIASLMALFADSSLCKNLPPGAQWMSVSELEAFFGELPFGLGWWEPQNSHRLDPSPAEAQQAEEKTDWFGIDFGTPKHKGYCRRGV